MQNRTGYLTVYSADRTQIYGEFADAAWRMEDTRGGVNHLFAGKASDGTIDTFRRLNAYGIANVTYAFDTNGHRYAGSAQLLAPDTWDGQAVIQIESGDSPERVPMG